MSLKNRYQNHLAIVFLGGPSINSYIHKIQKLDRDRFVLFLEPRSLSQKLLEFKINPDYVICPFSAKLKDNNFQNIILRSFLSKINIKRFIKSKFFREVDFLKNNFESIYEKWRPDRGIHKRYRIKNNIFLKNSPFENLKYFPNAKIFLDFDDFNKEFSDCKLSNNILKLGFENYNKQFDINDYYDIREKKEKLIFQKTNFLNTHSVCHFPLLDFLGFQKVFFLGMDMNFYGNFEHENLKIFKSKIHFYIFLLLIRNSLNGNFKLNFPIYMRPKEEFFTLDQVLKPDNKFFRVVSKKDNLISKIKTIEEKEFFNIYT